MTKSASIRAAVSPADIAQAILLFRAYAASLPIDLAYQDFEDELASMPGKYAPPAGTILLARTANEAAIGCVALRPLDPSGCCEMKRLYVSPQGRGLGLGRALVNAVISEAERIGYREMRLDTLPGMNEAISLYHRSGFREIAPYYDTPVVGTIFMACPLGDHRPTARG
jgi:ribosomal protein S18 acetylase RimI-like enzyme